MFGFLIVTNLQAGTLSQRPPSTSLPFFLALSEAPAAVQTVGVTNQTSPFVNYIWIIRSARWLCLQLSLGHTLSLSHSFISLFPSFSQTGCCSFYGTATWQLANILEQTNNNNGRDLACKVDQTAKVNKHFAHCAWPLPLPLLLTHPFASPSPLFNPSASAGFSVRCNLGFVAQLKLNANRKTRTLTHKNAHCTHTETHTRTALKFTRFPFQLKQFQLQAQLPCPTPRPGPVSIYRHSLRAPLSRQCFLCALLFSACKWAKYRQHVCVCVVANYL